MMKTITRRLILVLTLVLITTWVPGSVMASKGADLLELQQVSDNVYAIVGPYGNRTSENLANNATFGFVITSDGVVLIDSGGSHLGAAAIESRIQEITDKPVKVVISTGGQDHRWLGNGYFKQRGARIITSAAAMADHRERARDQLFVLSNLVGESGMAETEAVYADETFDDALKLEIGGVRIELVKVGPAHTPGDTLVWLPSERVVFTGDVVYVGRMLGVIGVSSSSHWINAFDSMAALEPAVIVPGHGPATKLSRARADTYDYLVFLRETIGSFMDEGGDITAVGSLDQSRFSYLENFTELRGRNAQRVFEEMEWE